MSTDAEVDLMSWFKVDDKFHSHPKAMRAGTPACGLWARCGAWVSDQLTDGMIPGEVAHMYGTDELIENLVKAGLWEVEPEGYRIHDYLDYNPSREKVLADREAARTRQQRSRSQRDSRVSSDAPYPYPNPSSSRTYEPQNFTVTDAVSHGVTDGVTSPNLRTAQAATDRGNRLLNDHLDALAEDHQPHPPRQVIKDLGKIIDGLISEDFADDAIHSGLRMLRGNPKFAGSPNMLPRFVAQCQSQTHARTRAPKGQMWG